MTNKIGMRRWDTGRWEQHLGEQVRRARHAEQLSQSDLASKANVNRNSISALERGEGSSLATLIRVVRALGRADWLEELAPDPGLSPLELLRLQQAQQTVRVRSQLRSDEAETR